MDSSSINPYHNQQNQNCGLTRYSSAPSSLLANLMDCTENLSNCGNNNFGVSEDYNHYVRSGSPEVETILARFMSLYNESEDKGSQNLHGFREGLVKQEVEHVQQQKRLYTGPSSVMYQIQEVQGLQDHNTANGCVGTNLERSFGENCVAFENSMRSRVGNGNGSNLVRQSSSPARIFATLTAENGSAMPNDVRSFRTCNGTKGDTNPSSSRMKRELNFSSGLSSCSNLMPQIAEEGNENMVISNTEDQSSWDDFAFSGLKRARDDNSHVFSTANALQIQTADSRSGLHNLTHHLSLPKTFNEAATTEKFLQFQDAVPCKIRAKRGCATHPRSIAERMRRTRISERMKKLQELFPDMDKQTSTADMLDLAVEYIKGLQKQVKTLTDCKEKCKCSRKHIHESSNICA